MKEKNYVKEGFLDDLVEQRYCDREDLYIVLEDLKLKKLDVLKVGEKYSFVLFNEEYYLVDIDVSLFAPGCVEVPISKVKKIDGKANRLILTRVNSDVNSDLVQRLYSVVEKYYKNILLAL